MATPTRYKNFLLNSFGNNNINLTAGTVKLALLSDSYSPTGAESTWDSISSHEITAANGYTAGGETILNPATVVNGSGELTFTGDNVVWASNPVGFNLARYAVLYNADGVATTNALIAYITLTAPANNLDEALTFAWGSHILKIT